MKRNTWLEQYLAGGKRPVLLIVDDQPVNIHALNEIFRKDFEVLMATSGESAIQTALGQQPDVILLDIIMPGIDGYQVCQTLSENPLTANIPIIFVSAETDAAVESHGFSVGAVDFITKPFNPLIVRARVMTHLTLKLQMDVMTNMATIDGLTGLSNRLRLDEDLDVHWHLCQRENKPLSMLMVDVDHFKRYNDHYGHLAGDECLKQIARALQKSVRRTQDLCCRYGGEEFACLLPCSGEEGASACARTVLEEVCALGIEHATSPAAEIVTVSIGVASLVPTRERSPEQLILHADQAMYQSKQNGRNRMTVFRDPPE